MMNQLRVVAYLLALMGVCEVDARGQASDRSASAVVVPGEYATESGWGHLLVSTASNGRLFFDLQSATGESVCRISGELEGLEGAATSEDGKDCKIVFSRRLAGVDVATITPEACRDLCGSNGGVAGFYMYLPMECRANELSGTRRMFKDRYLNKDYRSALNTLKPVLETCGTVMDFVDLGDIRNDVAITQLKNGLAHDCLETLKPYFADAARDDGEILGDWPADQAEAYRRVIRAARTNIRLCRGNNRVVIPLNVKNARQEN